MISNKMRMIILCSRTIIPYHVMIILYFLLHDNDHSQLYDDFLFLEGGFYDFGDIYYCVSDVCDPL